MKRYFVTSAIVLFTCTTVVVAVSPGVGGSSGKPPMSNKPLPPKPPQSSPVVVESFIKELYDIGFRSKPGHLPTPREIKDFIKQQPINTGLAIERHLEKIGYAEYFDNVSARIVPSPAITQFMRYLRVEGFRSNEELPSPEAIRRFAGNQPYAIKKDILRKMDESRYEEYFRVVKEEIRRVAAEVEYEKLVADQKRLEEAEARAQKSNEKVGGLDQQVLAEVRQLQQRYANGTTSELPPGFKRVVKINFLKDTLKQLYEFMKIHNINESVLYKRMKLFYQREVGELGMHRVKNYPGTWEFHLTKGDVLILKETTIPNVFEFQEVMQHDDFMSKYRK